MALRSADGTRHRFKLLRSGAVVSLATSLASDFAPKVRSNVVVPGPVRTEFWSPNADGILNQLGKGCLTGKVADPLDTAEAFLYWSVRN